jgi:hypothetical protein
MINGMTAEDEIKKLKGMIHIRSIMEERWEDEIKINLNSEQTTWWLRQGINALEVITE